MSMNIEKRLVVHLEQHGRTLQGHVLYQNEALRNTNPVDWFKIAKKAKGIIKQITTDDSPDMHSGILFIRGASISLDHRIFEREFDSEEEAATAKADIEELVDYINSDAFKMGGTVPEKVVYPVKRTGYISKELSSGVRYLRGCGGLVRVPPELLGDDITNRMVGNKDYLVEITLHALEEAE